MIEIGILKHFDSGTYKAGVQFAGSLTTYFDDISVARNVPAAAMVTGNYVIVAVPGGNPRDACVIAAWPEGSAGGGSFVDLSDTPASYSGQAGKPVRVNSGANALEFGTAGCVFKALAARGKIWRFPAIGSTNRTATVSSVSADVITLTANVADQFFTDSMEGYAYLLIRNTTCSQNAWVKAYVAANQLQVTDSADIAAWQNGESIRGHSEIHPQYTLYTDLDVTLSVGASAKQAFLYTYLKDTAANSQNIIYASSANIAVVGQAANIYNIATGVLSLSPGRVLAVRTIAAAVALESVVDITAYTEEI
jgi:hypothetical protein